MGAYCFEHLEKKGIKTHYRGLVDADGKTVKFSELKQPSNSMEVNLVNVYKPKTRIVGSKILHDYGMYTKPSRAALSRLKSFIVMVYLRAHQFLDGWIKAK